MYTPTMIAESDYEGWVGWVDGAPVLNPSTNGLVAWDGCTPIFEEVPHQPTLFPLAHGLEDRARNVNFGDRKTLDWKQLPHERVMILELYAFRNTYGNQPLVTLYRNVNRDVRWIQFKRGSIVVPGGLVTKERNEDKFGTSQRRTGINSWCVGYWDRTVGQCEMIEFFAAGGEPQRWSHDGANHPCWPKPMGFGLSPVVLGLTEEDITPMPKAFVESGI